LFEEKCENHFLLLLVEEDVSSYWMTLRKKRRYWNLKEEALDCTLWRTRFGRGYGPVVKQTTE
jgi:hypothetical protein